MWLDKQLVRAFLRTFLGLSEFFDFCFILEKECVWVGERAEGGRERKKEREGGRKNESQAGSMVTGSAWVQHGAQSQDPGIMTKSQTLNQLSNPGTLQTFLSNLQTCLNFNLKKKNQANSISLKYLIFSGFLNFKFLFMYFCSLIVMLEIYLNFFSWKNTANYWEIITSFAKLWLIPLERNLLFVHYYSTNCEFWNEDTLIMN